MVNNLSTEEVFESAVSIVRNLPKEGSIKPSDELKLKLYAYFKQATHGPNDTPKPRFYQIVEAYKWDAWLKLGNMSKEEAMLSYISELKSIMESMPEEENDPEANKRMEEVLGKKFYDYWFNQWKRQERKTNLTSGSDSVTINEDRKSVPSGNETHSSSSSGSSMSMLEDTQSAGDGYKTPTSVAFRDTFTGGDVSDQFALAVLRLQQGLEATNIRISLVENQLKQTMTSLQKLENQTHSKQFQPSATHSIRSRSSSSGNLINFLRSIKAIHWFYLSYPFLVYFIVRSLERRNRNGKSCK